MSQVFFSMCASPSAYPGIVNLYLDNLFLNALGSAAPSKVLGYWCS